MNDKYTRWKLYAGGLAIVFDLLLIVPHYFSPAVPLPSPAEYITTPLLVMVVELLIEAISRLELTDPIPNKMEDVEKQLASLFEAVAKLDRESLPSQVSAFKKRSKDYLGQYLGTFVNDVVGALEIMEAHYEVTHQMLAVYSYAELWRTLALIQRSQGKEDPIAVHAVHCFDPGVFDEKLLERQKAFVDNGGSIERILCGGDALPNEKVLTVAKAMAEKGISVRYHQRDVESVGFNYAWDYLYIPRTREAVIWASASREGRIDKAIFSQTGVYNRKNLEELWLTIRRRSILISAPQEIAAPVTALGQTGAPRPEQPAT